MKPDPGIEWIRMVRSRISQESHNCPKEFIAFHRSLRAKYASKDQTAEPPGQIAASARQPER